MKSIFIIMTILGLVSYVYGNGSWQDYVDNNLAGPGNVRKGAIIDHDGNIWAKSKDFLLKPGEIKKIAEAYKNINSARANGLFLEGQKYLIIKADDRSIYGKKGTAGFAIAKSEKAIVIGIYDHTMQPGQASSTVEKLVDYLIELGY